MNVVNHFKGCSKNNFYKADKTFRLPKIGLYKGLFQYYEDSKRIED